MAEVSSQPLLPSSNVLAVVPFMDRAAFAARVGVSADVVEGWIRHGHVSTVTIGRRSLVDLRPWMQQK